MANLIGGIAPYRGKDNYIEGTRGDDVIFGDPYTTGNFEGLPEIEDDEDSVSNLVRRIVSGALKSIPPKRRSDPEIVENALQRAVRGEVNAWWGKKPNVTVFVHRI